MANYDFKSLSPWEFEQLSRDLLKAARGIDFEVFKEGRDRGIDLRYSEGEGDVIAQCKHYANSKVSNLISNLRNMELEKVKRLDPSSYILITSLGLTPDNKSQILQILTPFIKTVSNIISKETLNSWLSDNPGVERNHFNLWACTVPIMERILHSGIYNYSVSQMDILRERLQYYVKSPNFEVARGILKSQHFCIIAGAPGIGKTTLAEMLMIEYMELGFEPIKVTEDIEEAFRLLNTKSKQVFYYDDFLGQTGLDQKLNKNEDQRIVDFCNLCSRTKNTLFVMTTREYILNQAKNAYEKLERAGLDAKKCILNANTYTLLDKAKIFYNHLHFKGVPEEYIRNIVRDERYFLVIKNPSFNPRVIETVTEKSFIERTNPDTYVKDIVGLLNRPHIIWEHAYKNQLTQPSRHLLLVVLSCLNQIKLSDCISLFNIFRENYRKAYGVNRSPDDFQKSLKECEGDFLEISLYKDTQIIGFRNPSVKDYLTFYLSQEVEILEILIESISNFTQVRSLWNSFRSLEHNPLKSEKRLLDLFLNRAAETIHTKNLAVSIHMRSRGVVLFHYQETNLLDHCSFVLRMKIEKPTSSLKKTLIDCFDLAYEHLELRKVYDWEKHISNLYQIRENRSQYSFEYEQYLESVLKVLPTQLNQVADYKVLAELCEWSDNAKSQLAYKFEEFSRQLDTNFDDEIRYVNSVDDIATLEEYESDLQKINHVFGETKEINERISEVMGLITELYDEQDECATESEESKDDKPTSESNTKQTIMSLFRTL